MTKQYTKLMLRGFNGECDAAVANVAWNNAERMEERVHKAFDALNQLGSVMQMSLTPEFLQLKLDELRLTHEYQEKRHQEREEQRRIREQIREDEKAQQELDKAREQAEREEARLALAGAQAEAVAAREALNALMGITATDAAWRAPSRLPELPASELSLQRLEADALSASLDIAAAKQRLRAAAAHADVANVSGWLPELKAGVSAERSGDWGVGPAVQLELPLFYQGQGEVGVARARMKREQHLYADAAVQVRSAARAVQSRLDAARRGVVHAHDVVLPLRERVVQQTQLEYNGMLVGIFQLLEAKRQELAAAEQFLSLRRDYWLSRLEAEQLLAGRRPRHD